MVKDVLNKHRECEMFFQAFSQNTIKCNKIVQVLINKPLGTNKGVES